MANERTPMRKIREILRLKFVSHLSRNAIARSVNVSGSTVSDYLERAQLVGLDSWEKIQALDEDALERELGIYSSSAAASPSDPIARPAARPLPDFAHVNEELRRPGVTIELLWSEYRSSHFDGYSYSQFCEHYGRWKKKLGLVMRQHHRAGEKTFVDYSGDSLSLTDPKTGEKRSTQLFVGVLGASSYTYAEATLTQAIPDWLLSHARMYEFFGGVSEVTVPDNLKSGVKHACFYDPEINPSYQDLAVHYGTAIVPTRVRKPRDKAKAEAGVRFAQRWIVAVLRNHTFYSLHDMNQAIRNCLEQLNAKKMRHYKKSRRELFESLDRPALKPLPPTRYEFSEWKKARVNIDYHIEFDHHFYSVPYALVHKHVEVRASSETLEVFFRGKRVASHLRSLSRGRSTTLPEHMPSSHRAYAEWTPSRMISWAQSIGPEVAALVKRVLADKPHPEMGFRQVLGIIRLGKTYSHERLRAACARALHLGSPTYRTIQSMLKAGKESEPLPSGSGKNSVSNGKGDERCWTWEFSKLKSIYLS